MELVKDLTERDRSVQSLGKYELIARIGVGGMAEVFLARQRGFMNFRKLVVIKRIHPHLAKQQEFINMLLDEARISALLKHPRVVDIYDLGKDDDTYFIAMEYLAGQSLTEIIKAGRKRRKIDIYSAARILADAAEGLDAAHNLKTFAGEPLELVHRDVSPGNIIVQYNGDVKIVDFGVSKAKGRLSETGVRKVKGKLGYASPEQVSGRPIDRRADIFALGVVMWELLAHRRLFMAQSSAATLKMILDGNPRPPSDYRRETPRELDEICLRALSVDPADRYQNASDMQEELQDYLRAANYYRESKIIAKYMDDMFAHRRREQEELIRRVAEATQEIDLEYEDDGGFEEEESKDTEVGVVPPPSSAKTRQMDAKTIAEMAESSVDKNRPLPSAIKAKSLLHGQALLDEDDDDDDFITTVESVSDMKMRIAARHDTQVDDKTEPNVPAVTAAKLRKLSPLPPPNKPPSKAPSKGPSRPRRPSKTAYQAMRKRPGKGAVDRVREAAANAAIAKEDETTDQDFGPKKTIKSTNPPMPETDQVVKSSQGGIAAVASGETESRKAPEGLDPTEIVEPLEDEAAQPAPVNNRKWVFLGGGLVVLAVVLFTVIGGGGNNVPSASVGEPATTASNTNDPDDPPTDNPTAIDDPTDDDPADEPPDDDPAPESADQSTDDTADDPPDDPAKPTSKQTAIGLDKDPPAKHSPAKKDPPAKHSPAKKDPPAKHSPAKDPADNVPTIDIPDDVIESHPPKHKLSKTRAEIRAKKKADREKAKTLNQEAVGLFVRGKLNSARTKFAQAIRLNPGFALPHRGLGLLYEKQGKKSKAARELKRYLKLTPKARDAASISKRIKRLGG